MFIPADHSKIVSSSDGGCSCQFGLANASLHLRQALHQLQCISRRKEVLGESLTRQLNGVVASVAYVQMFDCVPLACAQILGRQLSSAMHT